MPSPFPHSYTDNLVLLEDGTVRFDCSYDEVVWPWLTLPPTHPIFVQTITFWGSIEAGMFLGTFDPEKWSALVQTEWTCGSKVAGLPRRGQYSVDRREARDRFHLEFFDAENVSIVKLSGEGVIFRRRNFESWRNESKKKVEKVDPPPFSYATMQELGVSTRGECFLAPFSGERPSSTVGLITRANGLMPGHPYIGGSGDHVNSTHMGEVGRQYGGLLLGRPFAVTQGAMEFMHYVELGSPFEVLLLEHGGSDRRYSLMVRQSDRDCTRITMHYDLEDGP